MSKPKLKDPCGVLNLESYKPPTLNDPTSFESGKYTFIDSNIEYVVEYDEGERKSYIENNKYIECKLYPKDSCYPNTIAINDVAMGKQKGMCSKSVAYALKVLLLEGAKENEFPFTGRVYLVIETKDACNAVNCYSHAFQMNGFQPDVKEKINFRNKHREHKKEMFLFLFSNFTSTTQKKKYDKLHQLKL